MADNTDSAGSSGATQIPDELAPGLDLFAATWLQKWTDAGGGVQIDRDGKGGFWRPEYWVSPEYVEPPADWPDALRDESASFRRNAYDGKMLALLDLLEALPCGAAAVKAHMHSHGLRSFVGRQGKFA